MVYGITRVRYIDHNYVKDCHIHAVKCNKILDNQLQSEETLLRTEVIQMLNYGHTFYTLIYNPQTSYLDWGAEVKIYFVNGQKFIKTEDNRKEKDNLENLPRF